MVSRLALCIAILTSQLYFGPSAAQNLPEIIANGSGSVSDLSGNSWPAIFELRGEDGQTSIVRFLAAGFEYYIVIAGYSDDEMGAQGHLQPCPDDDDGCICLLTLDESNKRMSGQCADVLTFEISDIREIE